MNLRNASRRCDIKQPYIACGGKNMKHGITENNRLKTIEIDKCESVSGSPETSHTARRAGRQEIFEQLKDHLEYLGMIPDDYFKLSEAESDIIPADWLDFNSIVSFDGSDGIFLDIYLNTSNGTQKFASGKTLNTSTDSFIWLSRIAAECNLMLNGNGCELFLPQDIADELRNTDNSEQIQNCGDEYDEFEP